MDKVRRRVEGWGACTLNTAGRLTLVRTVLASIPIHILAVSKIPKHVINILDRLLHDFLWGSKMGKRLLHWVNWDNCIKSFDVMGLDIRNSNICMCFSISRLAGTFFSVPLYGVNSVRQNIVLIGMGGMLQFRPFALQDGSPS